MAEMEVEAPALGLLPSDPAGLSNKKLDSKSDKEADDDAEELEEDQVQAISDEEEQSKPGDDDREEEDSVMDVEPDGKPGKRKNTRKPKTDSAPEMELNHDLCDSCGDGGDLLCCDNCPNAFHFECADPPVNPKNLPPGDWFCTTCNYKLGKLPLPSEASPLGKLIAFSAKSNTKAFSLPSFVRRFETPKKNDAKALDIFELLRSPDIALNRYVVVDKSAEFRISSKYQTVSFHKPNCHICGLDSDNVVKCVLCKKSYHRCCLDPMYFGSNSWMCSDHKGAAQYNKSRAEQAASDANQDDSSSSEDDRSRKLKEQSKVMAAQERAARVKERERLARLQRDTADDLPSPPPRPSSASTTKSTAFVSSTPARTQAMSPMDLSVMTAELVRRIRPTSTITHTAISDCLEGFMWPTPGDRWTQEKLYELAARIARRVDGKIIHHAPAASTSADDDGMPPAKRAKITEYKLENQPQYQASRIKKPRPPPPAKRAKPPAPPPAVTISTPPPSIPPPAKPNPPATTSSPAALAAVPAPAPPAQQLQRPFLALLNGKNADPAAPPQQFQVTVRKALVSIGRSNTKVDIDLQQFTQAKTVSHLHAEIQQIGPGSFQLLSHGRNGTRVNGEVYGKNHNPTDPPVKVPLKDSDRIVIGGIELTFFTAEGVAAGLTPPPV